MGLRDEDTGRAAERAGVLMEWVVDARADDGRVSGPVQARIRSILQQSTRDGV